MAMATKKENLEKIQIVMDKISSICKSEGGATYIGKDTVYNIPVLYFKIGHDRIMMMRFMIDGYSTNSNDCWACPIDYLKDQKPKEYYAIKDSNSICESTLQEILLIFDALILQSSDGTITNPKQIDNKDLLNLGLSELVVTLSSYDLRRYMVTESIKSILEMGETKPTDRLMNIICDEWRSNVRYLGINRYRDYRDQTWHRWLVRLNNSDDTYVSYRNEALNDFLYRLDIGDTRRSSIRSAMNEAGIPKVIIRKKTSEFKSGPITYSATSLVQLLERHEKSYMFDLESIDAEEIKLRSLLDKKYTEVVVYQKNIVLTGKKKADSVYSFDNEKTTDFVKRMKV